jgi:enediyne polyketide synthase
LHGAARNAPQLLRNLDVESFRRTLGLKVRGAENLLAAVDPEQLRLFVSFGSIIARIGLPGEADYGLANEWLARLTERFQQAHPTCRCLTIEWSVWSSVGMGARLGTLERLIGQGITPISLETGIAMLQRLLAQTTKLPASVVVSGRFGAPSTLQFEAAPLPFHRFLENIRVHYPGVELVIDANLSLDTDPYLNDHVFRGERLLPAVFGLEAMAQAAMALTGSSEPPSFEQTEFSRPIVVPKSGARTIRLVALVRERGEVDVALRSDETAFQVNHFQAVCRFGSNEMVAAGDEEALHRFPPLELDPIRELYGGLLFHQGRFRRLRAYQQVTARRCLAELSPDVEEAWFGRYLPGDLVLGNPTARDTVIHAIQVCVPGATLLPISVERLVPGARIIDAPRYVQARERVGEAGRDTVIFDVVVTDTAGNLLEQWQGLRLKMVGGSKFQGPWSPPVLGAYMERELAGLVSDQSISLIIERDSAGGRRVRSDRAIGRAIGRPAPVHRRPDGKPEIGGDWAVSVAHADDLTLAVAVAGNNGSPGCDLEPVVARTAETWRDLLGSERFTLAETIAQEAGEDQDTAATRVWTALESLKKAGVAPNQPLVLKGIDENGWVRLSAGAATIATLVSQIQTRPETLALAILVREAL